MKSLTLVLHLMLLLAASAGAQEVPAASESQAPVFRSGASLVALNVTVTDPEKHLVTGLRRDDFAVYEDGVPQQVRFFEASDVPIDLILLLDTSSSMSDKMDAVRSAGTGFLRTLRSGDRGAVVTFADSVNVVQPLVADRSLLEGAVAQTRARGATALHNALYIALKQFGRPANQDGAIRRQAIAVLTDGEDTCSLITFEDVMALARKSGVTVYAIGLRSKYGAAATVGGGRRYFSEAEYSLKTLAQDTGGQAFFPPDVGALEGIYASIAREVSSQYSIGYAPSNTRLDGRFRRIVVQILSRPDLRPKARSGYTAEETRTAGGSAIRP